MCEVKAVHVRVVDARGEVVVVPGRRYRLALDLDGERGRGGGRRATGDGEVRQAARMGQGCRYLVVAPGYWAEAHILADAEVLGAERGQACRVAGQAGGL